MKRSFIAFFIILMFSSACTNSSGAQASALSKPENQLSPTTPNAVQITEAPTQTPLPTELATTAPTVTQEPTITQEPTATPTEVPTPTEVVTPPEGFTSMEEAAKLGWVYEDANGDGQKELVQHMVVEDGEIVFDKADMVFLSQVEHLKGFRYTIPLVGGKQYGSGFFVDFEQPKPGFKWVLSNYGLNGIENNNVSEFLDLDRKHSGYSFSVKTDNEKKRYKYPPDKKSDNIIQKAVYSTSGDPIGLLSFGIQIPVDEIVQDIHMATRPGQLEYTIFEQGKMDSVTAK